MSARRELVFPPHLWRQAQAALFGRTGVEGFAFGLARPCPRPNGLVYQVETLITPEPSGYLARTVAGLSLSDAASSQFNQAAAAAAPQARVPLHLHSHPPGITQFSADDDQHEAALHHWLRAQGQPLLLSGVQAVDHSPQARLWAAGNPQPVALRVGLTALTPEMTDPSPTLDRQRAFGPGLGQAAAELWIGIIGLGGLGMLAVEQLARAGFRRFVLMDPDHVEASNLNRLPLEPGDLNRPKVAVAKTLIRRAAQAIGVTAEVHALTQNLYLADAAGRAALRRCDVLLALTDDELSRLTALQLAFEGGAEYLQAGVDIRLDAAGRISGLWAEVTGAEWGCYCPVCAGRLDPGQASLEARRYLGGAIWAQTQRDGYLPDVPSPAVMSLNSLAAGALVLEIQRRVAGLGSRDLWQLDFQSGQTRTFTTLDQHLPTGCGVCGRSERWPASEAAPLMRCAEPAAA